MMDLSIALSALHFLLASHDPPFCLIMGHGHTVIRAFPPNEKRLGQTVRGTGNYEEADCWHCSILGQKIISE
jgi:hypothetical protein